MTTSDYPITSTNTVERFAESTTMNERERSTTIYTTESSPTPTNFETSERIRSTTFSATATIIEYSAGELRFEIIHLLNPAYKC